MANSNTAVIGLQWGDEGKGKLVDILAENHDFVARFGGGANAGHTVYVNGRKHVFHLLPSGILYPEVGCVLGNGMVVDPVTLVDEIHSLPKEHAKIYVSNRANVVLPKHIEADKKKDETQKLGTTKRGIGPAYTDKISRNGVRFCDDWTHFFDANVSKELEQYVCDTRVLLQSALDKNKRILFEGAQATLLDVDHGTYPFVTSSSTSIGGVYTGTGVRPKDLCVIGVAKAYTTRVGEGTFPTELNNELGEFLRKKGGEFGATTGRPRRCGWFDAVATKYSVEVNGCDEAALTKLDVLSGLDEICVASKYVKMCPDGVNVKNAATIPASIDELKLCTPQYERVKGWNEDISKVRTFDGLPKNARDYVALIEQLVGVPITYVGVGPEREQIVKRSAHLKVSYFLW